MLITLDPGDHTISSGLVDRFDNHLAARAVVAHEIPGLVAVDDPADPRRVAIYDAVEGGVYLGGAADAGVTAAFNRWFHGEVTPFGKSLRRAGWFTIVVDGPDWLAYGDVLEAGTDGIPGQRLAYACTAPAITDWRDRLPDGVDVIAPDRAYFDGTPRANHDGVVEWAEKNFGTIDAFLARGFGRLVVTSERVVSWCLSDYVVDGPGGTRSEIGIGTDAEYRRRGFATIAVAATLEHAFAAGHVRVGWQCWQSNVASQRTAERAGFEQAEEYRAHFGWFNCVDNAIMCGISHLERDEFDHAVVRLENALAFIDAGHADLESSEFASYVSIVHYRVGVAHARLGHADEAFAHLEAAAVGGFSNAKGLGASEHFTALRGDPRWAALVDRVSANQRDG